jgi:lambda family phage portal protein
MFPYLYSPFNRGYAGAGGAVNSQTLSGFNSWSGTATADLMPVRMALVSRSRQLAISNPMASAAIDRMTGGIVGEGLSFVESGDDMADDVNTRFCLASHLHRLDAQRRQTFAQMQEMACRNWLLSGDVFYIRKTDADGISSWRAVESDRCQTPYFYSKFNDIGYEICVNPETQNRIIDGVELDGDSIPVAYWILKDYVEQPWIVSPEMIERIPAMDDAGRPLVLHLFRPLRPDQYRGVPLLAETIESLHATTGFIRSVEQAAQFQSSIWGFLTSENPTMDEMAPMFSRDLDEKIPLHPKNESTRPDEPVMTISADYPKENDQRALADKLFPRPKTVSAGELWQLKPGEDIKFLNPSNPNSNFGEYIKAQNGMVASAIGIPIQTLACSYDGTYASARGSVLEANRVFKRYRGFFLESFVKPIFEQFAFDCLVDVYGDDADFLSKYITLKSQWHSPTALCLDPTKEIDAWTKAIQLGLVDHDEAALSLYGHKATGTPEKPNKMVEVDEV